MSNDARPVDRKPKTLTLNDLLKLEFPPEDFIIGHGLLTRNSIMAIAAPPKSYKSFTLNTILLELLTGGNLFSVTRNHARSIEHLFPINPVKKVMLIEQEIGLVDTQLRLRELHDHLSPTHQEIVREGLFIRSCDYDLRLDKDGGFLKLACAIDEIRPDVVCIDPLTKFHTSDENSPSEMGQIMLHLRQLIHRFNTTVILLHHTGKQEEGKTTLDMLRGASSIAADIDTAMVFHVVNRDASIICIDVELRRGKPIPSFKIKLNHENLRAEFNGWVKGNGGYKREQVEQIIHKGPDTEQ